jgi:hypothetical protein
VAEFMVGGLGVVGLGFAVKAGLDQANQRRKSANGSKGQQHTSTPRTDGRADQQDWTYLPPSS